MCVVPGPWLRLLFACWVTRGFYFALWRQAWLFYRLVKLHNSHMSVSSPLLHHQQRLIFFEDYIVCGGREVTQALTKPARGTRSTKEKEGVRGPFITWHFRLSVLSNMQKTFSISSLVDANAIEWPSWMQGKFYLNAAFLSPHFWRSLPRERCTRDVCLFFSLHRYESSKASHYCLLRQKKGANKYFVSNIHVLDHWTIFAFLTWWRDGIIRFLIFQRRVFMMSSENRAWSTERNVYHKRPQTSARTSKLAKLCRVFTMFTPFYHVCIALKFLFVNDFAWNVRCIFLCFVGFFIPQKGKQKPHLFFRAESCLIQPKEAPMGPFAVHQSDGCAIQPPSNQAYTGTESFFFRQCEEDGKSYFFPRFFFFFWKVEKSGKCRAPGDFFF